MDSLYSGHQGVSFVLKGRYESIDAMVSAFKGGSNYNLVYYGEYVIIDTRNKNHIDNGKIYRRGYDYQNDMGGAEYIGQIVGPSSGTPYFQLNNIENTKKEATREVDNEVTYKRYPTGIDEDGRYTISENGNGGDLGIFNFSKEEQELVPGKTDEGEFNDTIKYTWVNIRDDTNAADSWFYVGFEWPYLVVDYKVHSSSPYDEQGDREDHAEVERTDDHSHPFWEEWDIGIPKGIKGDTLRHLRIITPTQEDVIYDYKNITVSKEDPWGYVTSWTEPGYDGQQDDIDKKRQIIVFDYIIYDHKQEGETITVYLGDYNQLKKVTLDDDGTLTLQFTHDNDTVFEKKIRWIDNIELTTNIGSEGGHWTFTFNNDTPEQTKEFDVSWIAGIEILDTGTLKYTYIGTPAPEILPENAEMLSDGVYQVEDFLQWIQSVNLDPNTGHFVVTNNRGEELYSTDLDWISDIYIDEETGEIAIHHIYDENNTGEAANGERAEVLEAKLKLVTEAYVNEEEGIFRFETNTGDVVNVYRIDDEGNKTSDEFRINYIKDMVVLPYNWHLLVLYSDATYRSDGTDLDENHKDSNGNIWLNNITGSDGTEYGADVYWQDFGPIKDQAGILVGFNVTDEQLKEAGHTSDILGYLNEQYPQGLTGEEQEIGGASTKGKLVVYSPNNEENKNFYAFDYLTNEWILLGGFDAANNLRDAIAYNDSATDVEKQTYLQNLRANGFALISKNYSVAAADETLPLYWAVDYIAE